MRHTGFISCTRYLSYGNGMGINHIEASHYSDAKENKKAIFPSFVKLLTNPRGDFTIASDYSYVLFNITMVMQIFDMNY